MSSPGGCYWDATVRPGQLFRAYVRSQVISLQDRLFNISRQSEWQWFSQFKFSRQSIELLAAARVPSGLRQLSRHVEFTGLDYVKFHSCRTIWLEGRLGYPERLIWFAPSAPKIHSIISVCNYLKVCLCILSWVETLSAWQYFGTLPGSQYFPLSLTLHIVAFQLLIPSI